MKLRPWHCVLAGAAVFALIVAVALATTGGSFADYANDQCRDHGGVQWLDAHQGSVVCRDGVAR